MIDDSIKCLVRFGRFTQAVVAEWLISKKKKKCARATAVNCGNITPVRSPRSGSKKALVLFFVATKKKKKGETSVFFFFIKIFNDGKWCRDFFTRDEKKKIQRKPLATAQAHDSPSRNLFLVEFSLWPARFPLFSPFFVFIVDLAYRPVRVYNIVTG